MAPPAGPALLSPQAAPPEPCPRDVTLPLLQMCNIPSLSTQLDLLLTLRELPVGVTDLQPVSPRHLPWRPTAALSDRRAAKITPADVHAIPLKAPAGVRLQTEMGSQSELTLGRQSFSFVLDG